MAVAMIRIAALLLAVVSVPVRSGVIRPGGPSSPHWNDTNGHRIEAHGGGMLLSEKDNRWYWYGESKKTDNISEHGVNCYSAPNLTGPWTFEGQVVSQSDIQIAGDSGPYIIERPKVLFNNHTSKFVLWFHLDKSGYTYRRAAIATADHAKGPFQFLYGWQPDGIPSLDMNLFRDPVDGEAYFIRSCDNKYVGISRFEGMAIFRLMGNHTYYVISSHLTGWNPNPLMLYRAAGKTLDDPAWVDMGNPTGNPTSFDSQPTFVVQHQDADGNPYFIYMADNWVHGGHDGLIDASYIWLPMQFFPNNVTIAWRDEWDPDHPFATPQCLPPAADQSIHLKTCNASVPSQQWNLPAAGKAGKVSLQSAAGLCLDTHGTDPTTGTPALVLATCNSTAQQNFVYNSTTGEIQRTSDGQCVDVAFCGATVCDGMGIELYHCGSPHDNQMREAVPEPVGARKYA